jgi:hypothetical protein
MRLLCTPFTAKAIFAAHNAANSWLIYRIQPHTLPDRAADIPNYFALDLL